MVINTILALVAMLAPVGQFEYINNESDFHCSMNGVESSYLVCGLPSEIEYIDYINDEGGYTFGVQINGKYFEFA